VASTSLETLLVREGVAASAAGSVWRRVAAYWELTKPRVAALIVMVSAAAFSLGSGPGVGAGRLLWLLAAVALLAAGIFALNQYMERDLDARMRRTASRPLPQGRLRPGEALAAGLIWSLAAILILAWRINPLSALVGIATFVSYLFVYTPLKTRTPHCTLIGALPGAMPPVLGWVAVRGELDWAALALFAILFCWQFPHFHAIAWLYREDYAAAGIRLWPVVELSGRTAGRQILLFTLLLLPVSLAPGLLGMSGAVYLAGAFLLGSVFLFYAVGVVRGNSNAASRKLLLVSVLYLPALFALMVLDR
jgi:heme o synthase